MVEPPAKRFCFSASKVKSPNEQEEKMNAVRLLQHYTKKLQKLSIAREVRDHRRTYESPYFTGSLRNYQQDGVNWLLDMFESGSNGILADEMGLGKTIQTIAFLAYLHKMGIKGPHLILVPLTTVEQWLSEFNKFAPSLQVLALYGHAQDRHRRIMAIKDYASSESIILAAYSSAEIEQKLILGLYFKIMIVDEGHKLKNFYSQFSIFVRKINTKFRFLLTGTPLQNNIIELWSLMNFVVPALFRSANVFDKLLIEDAIKDGTLPEEERNVHTVSAMHKALAPFLLRRLKSEVLSKELVEKKEIELVCQLTPLQEIMYQFITKNYTENIAIPQIVEGTKRRAAAKCLKKMKYFIAKTVVEKELPECFESDPPPVPFNYFDHYIKRELAKRGLEDDSYSHKFRCTDRSAVQLMKVTEHPYLIRAPYTSDDKVPMDERFVTTCGKMMALDALLPKLKVQGHKVIIFCKFLRMLDMLEDYLEMRNYKYQHFDGRHKIEDRTDATSKFNSDPEQFVFLLTARAGGLGINLTSADTVIFMTRDWNPQMDIQAQDRCHRIGQTRPVLIISLITEDTVDQRIVNCGLIKRQVEKVVIKDGTYRGSAVPFTSRDTDLEEVINSVKRAEKITRWTIDDLDRILDRTKLYQMMETKNNQGGGDENINPNIKLPFRSTF